MTPPARGPWPALRTQAYRAFYRLPSRWRRNIVRLVMPRYTVGAVTLVRDADAPEPGRLLLLRQPPGVGWTLPGGLLNRHERPAVGAARELAEETGISLPPEELRELVPNAVVHTDGHWIDLVFEARVPSTVEVVVDGAEVYEAVFHRLDALPPLTGPTARLLSYFGIGPYVDHPEVRQ
jgi:ADP-ribose pyrophosphatase YjhB (NUDIX family)